MSLTGPRIIMSGLTCAGKTTHGELLAEHYDIPYVPMRPIMRAVAAEMDASRSAVTEDWTPGVDAAREATDAIDLESDRRMKAAIESGPGVFDSWALPWLHTGTDAVRVWLASDQPSRARKCCVSALMKNQAPPSDPSRLVNEKDDFSSRQFARLYQFQLLPQDGLFDVVEDNSALIPEATIDCAEAGIAAFQPQLVRAIDQALRRARL